MKFNKNINVVPKLQYDIDNYKLHFTKQLKTYKELISYLNL